MEALIAFVLYVILAIPITIWEGFVIKTLWAWFIVPVFGLPVLAIAPALGLALVCSILTHQMPMGTEKMTPAELISRQLTTGLIGPAVVLFFGWIVNHFM